MSAYAVIKSGGKQHRVVVGEYLKVELLKAATGDSITDNEVLMVVDGDKIQIGVTPLEFRAEEKTVQPEKIGEPARRELRAVFRVIPGASPQPSPSETVRIALPELPQAKV